MICPTLPFSRLPLPEALDAIAEAGYRAVDLWSVPRMCEHMALDPHMARQAARDLHDRGLRCPVLTLYHNPVDTLESGLRCAAEIGADTVVLAPRDAYAGIEPFVELLRGLQPTCAALKVRIAAENHVNTSLDTLPSMQRLLANCPGPDIGICLAPPHTLSVGENPEAVAGALGERCFVCYLWSVRTGYDPVRDGGHYGTAEEQLPHNGKLDLSWVVAGAGARHPVLMFHGSAEWSHDKMIRELKDARLAMQAVT